MKAIERITLAMLILLNVAGCTSSSMDLQNQQDLLTNWKIQQSSKVDADGVVISTEQFLPQNWIDANTPSTVMGILSKMEEYQDILVGDNYFTASKAPFDSSWWYRTEFTIDKHLKDYHTLLNFDGISYSANIWLNGELIASKETVKGSFRRFEFDVTEKAKSGKNILALEIFRQQKGDFGLGFVDWNPRPLDENMGIWRDVTLSFVKNVQMKNQFVRSKVNLETLDEAWLSVGTELKNYSSQEIKGNLQINFEGETQKIPVTLKASEEKEIILTSNEIDFLHVQNPKLWWSNQLGESNMYKIDIRFIEEGQTSCSQTINFGIREIESYFNEAGHRGFKLNGKEILIKGAGWTDDIFLRDTPESIETQIRYVKDMGLNTIRLETIWGKDQTFFDLCDQYGILTMVGWSCQWEWDNYLGTSCDEFGGAQSESDIELLSEYLKNQITWLRNHPSIFVWMVGSDMLPRPELEKKYIEIFKKYDNRPWIGAASMRESELSGSTGVKMCGPYEYVGPSYWYLDKKNGGAYGFNTETGPGPQLPVKGTIVKTISDESEIWPLSSTWNLHCTTSSSAMNNMSILQDVVNNTWGEAQDFDDFVIKSHLVNYEAIRAMFEAFRTNRPNATGIIQWMLNSAWPSFYWQLYDYYLIPTPAYYGVKKALAPIQLMYDYGDKSISLSNESLNNFEGEAIISIYSINSRETKEQKIPIAINGNSVKKLTILEPWNNNIFLNLELVNKSGENITDNSYWLASKSEVFNWKASNWYYTPMTQYHNYSDFKMLSNTNIVIEKKSEEKSATGNLLTFQFNNPSETISFFNQIKVSDENGEWIASVLYSDNYFSIMPGKSKTIKINIPASAKAYSLEISGWNTTTQVLPLK